MAPTPHDQRDPEEGVERDQQDLHDPSSLAGDAAEAEHPGDDRP
jgi:hypothetical protein